MWIVNKHTEKYSQIIFLMQFFLLFQNKQVELISTVDGQKRMIKIQTSHLKYCMYIEGYLTEYWIIFQLPLL